MTKETIQLKALCTELKIDPREARVKLRLAVKDPKKFPDLHAATEVRKHAERAVGGWDQIVGLWKPLDRVGRIDGKGPLPANAVSVDRPIPRLRRHDFTRVDRGSRFHRDDREEVLAVSVVRGSRS